MVPRAMKNPRIIYIPHGRTDGGGFIYTIGKRGELQSEIEFHNADEKDAILKNLASAKPLEEPIKTSIPDIPKIKEVRINKKPFIFDRNVLTSFVQNTIDGANLRTKVDFISPSYDIFDTNFISLLPNEEKPDNYIQIFPIEPEPNQSVDILSQSDVNYLLHPQRTIDTHVNLIALTPNKEKPRNLIQRIISYPEPNQPDDTSSSGVSLILTSQLVRQ